MTDIWTLTGKLESAHRIMLKSVGEVVREIICLKKLGAVYVLYLCFVTLSIEHKHYADVYCTLPILR